MTYDSPGTPTKTVREELLAPLRRVLEWQLSMRESDGSIRCPEHGVEHTGKSAGVIVLALELARRDPRADVDRLREVALEQGRRLVGNLVNEENSPCYTFRPGRHDPFNCSNSVIDGGAAADALGALARELGGEQASEFSAASLLHARTYLRYAVIDKGIPAQRAWGLTGLASAWRNEPDDVLRDAALEALELLARIQRADGSYPYHPREWGAEHVGSSDASAYYQSRVTAFLIHGLEDLGLDPTSSEYAAPLRRGLEFLAALHGPDGTKCGLVEAKPWYWGATYEVASHPFDVFALCAGWRLFGEERWGRAALAAYRAWERHLDSDGAPRSHLPGPGRGRSYQCPLFWAGHAMWAARALGDLEAIHETLEGPAESSSCALEVRVFEETSLVRLEDSTVVAWVRGSRPGVNVAHGSPHGAGLLRVVRKADGRELLTRCRLGGNQSAEWSGLAGNFSPLRGWRAGGREVRFSTWLARVHWRAGRRLRALCTPLITLRRGVLAFAHARVSSAFALEAELTHDESSVTLRSPLAWRDGSSVPGSALQREFRVDGRGLLVSEKLLSSAAARDVDYRLPQGAIEIVRDGEEIRYRLA